MMNNKIETLKEEITTKDHGLVKEHFEHHKVQREKDVLRNEVNKVKKHTHLRRLLERKWVR